MSVFRFKHIETNLPELTTKTIDRKRYYVTPEGKEYPSITTVLTGRGKQGLSEWRKRVGDDVANYISQKAMKRGTAVHQMCEDYLNNVSFTEPNWWPNKQKNFLPFCLFNQLRNSVLQRVNNIHAQECGLYSDKYKIAGRVDCIAEYNKVLSIIDFKTSTSERNDKYNENYYIQTAAYAEMYEERTGIPTDQIVILVVTEDGVVQEFVKSKHEYLPLLEGAINEFSIS